MICKEVKKNMEKAIERDLSFKKKFPFYCCQCKENTDGLSTCHWCDHMKGRWKSDCHHCEPSEEFIKQKREEENKEATKLFHKLLVKSKELGFH